MSTFTILNSVYQDRAFLLEYHICVHLLTIIFFIRIPYFCPFNDHSFLFEYHIFSIFWRYFLNFFFIQISYFCPFIDHNFSYTNTIFLSFWHAYFFYLNSTYFFFYTQQFIFYILHVLNACFMNCIFVTYAK